ncbi:MAG: response regulator [Chlamydiales bacterium]
MKKRILLADFDKEFIREILHGKHHALYEFETAGRGLECLEKIEKFSPDLLLVDLMLPEIHGIEILRRVRQKDAQKKVGVILMCAHAMIQNYHAALQAGTDYFLEKPCEIDQLYTIFSRYFAGQLTPAPFSGKESFEERKEESFIPPVHSHSSYLKFWGTRGSNPVSGQKYIRYGGNTPCLEIREKNEIVIIDAGTGIRALGDMPAVRKAKAINLIIGHTHWDHIIGFPFFAPLYNPDCHVTIWSPIGFEKSTRELFTEMLGYAYFPVCLDDIRAKLTFKDIHEGVPFSIGKIEINSHYAFHPGATLCFKICVGENCFGYATDNEFLMGYQGNPAEITKDHFLLESYTSLLKFFHDCDFLIHEAQYFSDEYKEKVGWGHSSVSNAAVLIKRCGIKEWIVTHHDPSHTDDDLQRKLQLHNEVLEACKHPCRVRMAYDGFTIPL